jgi:tetratricopeptide (TPR) repeat protein
MHRTSLTYVLVVAAVFFTACSRDPETAKREYLASGDRYLAEKKYSEAIVEYRNALQRDAKFGDARLKLTDAYLATGDLRNAIGESVRAADVMPDNVDAQLRAGSLLLLSKQYNEAKQRALAALARDPKSPRALILLGNALAGLKDIDGAIEQVREAIDQDPQLTFTYTNLADLYAAKGDKEAAERAFKAAIQIAPKSVDAHLGLANFLWAQRRREEAEGELKAAAELDPKSALVNRTLATFYIGQGRAAEALPYVERYAEVMKTVEARLTLADFYVSNKNIAAATKSLNDIAKDPRGLSSATVRLAMLSFHDGRKAEAYGRLEGVLAKQPNDEAVLQAKTRFLLLEGRNQEALKVTDSMMAINAESPTSQYLRGYALEKLGSVQEATAIYLNLLKINPSWVAVQTRLASVYLRQNAAKDALGYAEQVVKAQPQAGPAHYLYAQALLRSGNINRAEQELNMLAKAAPSSPDVQTWLGMLYEAKHDIARARQAYQKASELQPGAVPAIAGLVSVDLAEKKNAAAISRIESQLAARPGDVDLMSLYGMALASVGDLTRAEATYQKVVEASPNNLDAYSRLAGIYLAQNRLDDARTRYEEIVKRDPKSVAAETMLGTILAQQNKSEESRKHFERALEIDPRTPVAANNLAWDYANNGGNLDVALQLAQTAKAVLPDNASVSDTLGWVYYKKGLASLAVTALEQAATQDTSSANIRYHLGLALAQQGNKPDARKALGDALRLNPSFPSAADAKRTLASLSES